MITNPTVIRTLDTRSLIAVTVTGSNGDNVGGTVTVSKDGVSYTGTTDNNGQANIFVDSPGSWTVGYDKSGITASGSVSVVYSGYSYAVSLSLSKSATITIHNSGGDNLLVTYDGTTTTVSIGATMTLPTLTFSTSAEITSQATTLYVSRDITMTVDGSSVLLRLSAYYWNTPNIEYYKNSTSATLPITLNNGDIIDIYAYPDD